MSIGLGYALFVSVVCAFFGWTNYGFVNFQTTKPIVCGTLVGLILGDVQTGIFIGGTLTLVYMGVQGIGAAIPVNSTTATTVTTALCIITKIDVETALALAVPVSVMGQLGRMAAWTINSLHNSSWLTTVKEAIKLVVPSLIRPSATLFTLKDGLLIKS